MEEKRPMIDDLDRRNRVVVIGELNADMIVGGMDSLPLLGKELIARECRTVLGSSSAICASGMAHLGVSVDYVGKIGNDDRGRFVQNALELLNIGTTHLVVDPEIATGITISLTFPADRAMITYLGSISALSFEEIDLSVLMGCHHLHVGSYYLQHSLQPRLTELFSAAHDAGVSVSMDTGCDPDDRWRDGRLVDLLELVEIFLPNEMEACAIAGIDSVERAAQWLATRCPLVVVKLGVEGALAADSSGRIIRQAGFKVDAVDTTGAGDSFDAGFVYSYVICGLSLSRALRVANACGALSTLGYGGTAAQPSVQELDEFMRRHPED